jgi:phosphate transport system substrate-binding protein
MAALRAAVFAALFFVSGALGAAAQDVTLRSRDGAIEISGTLLGFDGEFYRVESRFGELTVDGSGVTCSGMGCPSLVDFVAEVGISGSATIGRVLMPALIEGFALRSGLSAERLGQAADPARFTYVLSDAERVVGRFHIHVTNTDEGFADLLADEADIVMAMREIRPAEVTQAREAGLGDMTDARRSRVIALDAMVPIVEAGNPVSALSIADILRVLSGRIDSWAAFGGPEAPITVHLRGERSGLSQAMEDRLLRPARATLAAPVERHASNQALAAAVAADPFGLGLASFSEIGLAKPLVLTGPCGFQLRAARRSIKTEDYPLTAPMFLYVPARRLAALAREFLSYTRSTAAQIVIRRAGFVDQEPEAVPLDLQGDRFANAVLVAREAGGLERLQEMTRALMRKERLSLSFRFEAGSARLDAQSRSNVMQLANALESGAYDGRELLFAGFSDGAGPAAGNRSIAERRAEAVLAAVQQAADTADLSRVTLSARAFGEAMPMACDDTAWGRQVNRRVEVWVD